jgi:secreted trypsin-like serine protease
VLEVKKVYIRSDYQPATSSANDLAVLELRVGVIFTDDGKAVKPACLPSADFTLPDTAALYIAGWGTTSFRGATAQYLQEAAIDYFPDAQCKTLWSDLNDKAMLCAGKLAGGVDTCQGDSGGPLIYANGNTPLLVGVTSFGAGCGEANSPGVYVDVVNYVDWILSVVNGQVDASVLSAKALAQSGATEPKKVRVQVSTTYSAYIIKQKQDPAAYGQATAPGSPAGAGTTQASLNGARPLLTNAALIGCVLASVLFLMF